MKPLGSAFERQAFPIFLACLTIGLFAAYGGVLRSPFVFDDFSAIPDNPSLHSFSAALHPPANTTVSGRPLVNLSFALNWALSGNRLPAYHLTNIAILWSSAALLFGLVRRILRQMGEPWAASAGIAAGAVALLWALHPLQTESVTYIVQRVESLMGLCYLAVLYCVARHAGAAQPARFTRWSLFAVLFCWLGMAAKEVMVSAPVIAFALDRTFFARSWAEAWRRRRWMYTAMALSWILLTILVLSTNGRSGTAGFSLHFTWPQFLRTQAYAIVHYLRLSGWPSGQILDYGTYWIDPFWRWFPAVLLVAVLAGTTAWLVVEGHAVGWLGWWFFAVLAPTSLVPVVRQTMAEHRMYLALAPITVGVTMAAIRWAGLRAVVALLVGAAVLTGLTAHRNRTYASELILWQDVVTKLPGNAHAQDNLGRALIDLGRNPEAEPHLRLALRLDPELPEAWANLGVIEAKSGRLREAEVDDQRSLALKPEAPTALINYASLLVATGRPNQAIARLLAAIKLAPELALALDPGLAAAYANEAEALTRSGDTAKALAAYRDGEARDPQAGDLRYNHGNLAFQLGDYAGAAMLYAEAVRLDPGLAQAYANRGEALARLGRVGEASAAYREAETRDPQSAEMRYNHGNIAFKAGDFAGAIGLYAEAVRLKPDWARAHYNLAIALYRAGQVAPACEQFEAALRLEPNNAEVHNSYGAVLLAQARAAEALSQFEAAQRLNAGLPGLSENLAAARRALIRR